MQALVLRRPRPRRALITAHAPDGYRLFAVDLKRPEVQPQPDSWVAVGMGPTDTIDVVFDGLLVGPAAAVGGPGWYLSRPGFWSGGMGVAACWYGGALGAARTLALGVRARGDVHALAHLGAVDAACVTMATMLREAARRVDRSGLDSSSAKTLMMQVRAIVEQLCTDVLARTGWALGAGALAHDERHARRAADLPVYLRQHRAEHDLAVLGRDALDQHRLT